MIDLRKTKTKFERHFSCYQCSKYFEINEIRYIWRLTIPTTWINSFLTTTSCDNCFKTNMHYLRNYFIDFTEDEIE